MEGCFLIRKKRRSYIRERNRRDRRSDQAIEELALWGLASIKFPRRQSKVRKKISLN
jgi:hypothetical protein